MKNILFLMSQHPDVDHLVPLADLLSDEYRVSVLTYHEAVNQDDPRLTYLRTKDIRVWPISKFYPPNDLNIDILERIRAKNAYKVKNTKPYMIFGKNAKAVMPQYWMFKASRYIQAKLINYWLSMDWGLDVLRFFYPNAIVIDHAFNTPYIANLIHHAKQRNIPIIAVPHSAYPFTTTWHGTRGKQITKEQFPWDYVLVENAMRRKMLEEAGVNNEFIQLGCVRFTQWWLRRSPMEKETYPRIPYLYLGMNTASTLPDGIKDLQTVLNKHHVPVKIPVRRNQKETYDGFNHVIGQEVNTPALINAADCIITTATSVINDAILKYKPIIFAKFTIGEDTLFSDHGIGRTVNSAHELDIMLTKKAKPPISKHEDYMRQCVWGGMDEKHLLNEYKELFTWIK